MIKIAAKFSRQLLMHSSVSKSFEKSVVFIFDPEGIGNIFPRNVGFYFIL
jgi:hypothetical protein